MDLPRYLLDIEKQLSATNFGDVNFHVKRHRSSVSKMEVTTHSKLKYDDNEAAFADIATLMNNLIELRHTGDVQFKVTYKDGNIVMNTYKNTNIITYRDKQ